MAGSICRGVSHLPDADPNLQSVENLSQAPTVPAPRFGIPDLMPIGVTLVPDACCNAWQMFIATGLACSRRIGTQVAIFQIAGRGGVGALLYRGKVGFASNILPALLEYGCERICGGGIDAVGRKFAGLGSNPSPHARVRKMNGTIEHMQPSATDWNTPDEWTDEDLLLEYRSEGDRRAFDELVHRYERELFGYLRHYLGDAEMAEDVFQQTFLQVHLKCGQFDPGRRVRPWLYTVATNQAIDLQRRNRRHQMLSLDRRTGRDGNEDTGALAELLDSPEPDPLAEALSTEQRRLVQQAVDDLPEQTRQVVILVYFQGLKYREAAEVMSIPVGTVKSRLHAAINKLGEILTRTDLPK